LKSLLFKTKNKNEMKKIILLASVIFVSLVNLTAQYDKKAKNILDEVSEKTKSYTSISAKFKFIHKNIQENINNESQGVLELKGNKYRLKFMGNTFYCNGKIIWSHIEANEELNISEIDEEEPNILNPATMFTMYQKGYKYKFIQERFEEGRAVNIIDLFPENIEDSEFSRVRLGIDKDKKQIISVEYFSKDENRFIIKIVEYKTNVTIDDSIFTLEESEYPKGITVIDLRE